MSTTATTRGPDVIVAGAGPAGLAAAFRLQQAGLTVRVLESANRAGSKLSGLRREGFLLDTGAIFLPTSYHRLLKLIADVGIADRVVPGGFVFGLVRDGQIHELDGDHLIRGFAKTRALSLPGKLHAWKLGPEVVRSPRARPERITEAGRYDTETLGDWARRALSPELREQLIGPAIRGIFAAEPDAVSRVEFIGIINLFRGAKLVALRGGMQQLADQLSARLDIALGSRVLAVRQTSDGAEVTWRDADGEHTQSVQGCVIALPAQHAAAVREDLDPWRRQFLERVRQGKLITPNIALARAPTGVRATYTLIPRSDSPQLGGFGCDHLKAPGRAPAGKGLITLTLTNDWCERHHDEDNDSLHKRALEAIEPFLPGSTDHTEFVEITRWTQQYAPVGHYRNLGTFRAKTAESDRAVQFAGEYLSAPNLNAATATAEQAANDLLQTLHRKPVAV